MKEGELRPFLPQNDEDRIHKVEDLGDIEPVEHVCHLQTHGIVRVAHQLGVGETAGLPGGLDAHPRAHEDLKRVLCEKSIRIRTRGT